MDKLNSFANHGAQRLEPPQHGAVTLDGTVHDGASPEQRTERNRYRVDQAYRAYKGRGADPLPSNGREAQYSARNLKSAELLGTMIHQMGGGERSSAKGVFVDISI